MRDKVLLSYLIIDGVFVVTGALMLGFCVIVQNFMFETPKTGDQAARDLLYQQFPLTGMFPRVCPRDNIACKDRANHMIIQPASSTLSSYS
jgi:hypothetical protein